MKTSVETRIVNVEQDPRSAVSLAAATLMQGGLIALPTETVYGLAVLHGNDAALRNLRAIKGRDQDKPFQLLIAEPGDARGLGAIVSPLASELMRVFWPGPLTMVLPTTTGDAIGLRLPDSDLVRQVVRKTGLPLIATSANLTGQHAATTGKEVAAIFAGRVDLILNSSLKGMGVASTVVRVDDDKIEIPRVGGIDREQIMQVVDSTCQYTA